MFLAGRGSGRVRSRSLKGRRKQGAFSAVGTPPAGASPLPGKLTSVCLSCQAATVLQAAFRGHLARARLLSSTACVSEPPRVPSPPTQVPSGLPSDPSPLSVPISSHTPPTNKHWELPGGPVANTPPSKAGGAGLVPGRGDKIPHACGQNTENRSNIVRDSVKTLRLVHIQKSKQGKCRCLQALASCPALGVPPAPTPGHLAGLSSGAEWHGGTGTWSTVSTAGSRQA